MATGEFSTMKSIQRNIFSALEPKPSKTMTRVEELDAKMAEIRASL